LGAAVHGLEDHRVEVRLSAEEALRLGLTNWVVEADELAAKTREIAGRLARAPTVAYRYMTENLNRALSGEVAEYMDRREAAKAFAEKREPLFEGR
jgi:2-(1,2-epoxy-1,2-dihydrophenyl)acetyl-CoA isomerase